MEIAGGGDDGYGGDGGNDDDDCNNECTWQHYQEMGLLEIQGTNDDGDDQPALGSLRGVSKGT